MDGISLKIKEAQTCNIIQGIEITSTINITHLFLFNDILTFGIFREPYGKPCITYSLDLGLPMVSNPMVGNPPYSIL